MMASTHVAFGLTCWSAYAQIRGLPFQPESLLIAGVSSLLPDIDHPSSAFGRVVPFISYPISAIFGHRGITHSLFAIVAGVVALYIYSGQVWFMPPLIIGYLSHIFGDLVCNSGVPLFWPRKDKIAFPLFSTGGVLEFFIRILITCVLVWLILRSAASWVM